MAIFCMIKYWRLFLYRQTNKNTRIEQLRVLSNSLCLLKNHHYLLLGTIILFIIFVLLPFLSSIHNSKEKFLRVFFLSFAVGFFFFASTIFVGARACTTSKWNLYDYFYLFMFGFADTHTHRLVAHNKRNKFYHEKQKKNANYTQTFDRAWWPSNRSPSV